MRLLELLLLALFSILIATLQYFAMTYFLYWKFWWMDVLMHTLVGMFLGSVAVFIYKWRLHKCFIKMPLLSLLTIVLVIGVAWEVCEFVSGVPRAANYFADTASDVIFDLMGGLIAYLILWRKN